jgi:hypothetical protein
MRNLLIIFIITVFISSCNSGKYVAEFSKIKKGIDTLDVLPVDIQIKTVDFFKIQKYDPKLEQTVKFDILNQINSVLDKKYSIVLADSNNISDSLFYSGLEQMSDSIETQHNPIKGILVPSSFNNLKSSLKHKYSLILIVRSQYCINFPDRNNTLWINPLVNTYITEYLFLVDNINNTILHFKKTKTTGNVSIKLSVEQITLESLRGIYYK